MVLIIMVFIIMVFIIMRDFDNKLEQKHDLIASLPQPFLTYSSIPGYKDQCGNYEKLGSLLVIGNIYW